MKINKRIVFLELVLLFVFLFTACNQAEPESQYYTVTFINEGEEYCKKEVKEGLSVSCPTNPEKTGYDFDGWYNDGSAFNFSSPINADLQLTATWKTKRLTVKYVNYAEGVDASTVPKESIHDYNTSVTVAGGLSSEGLKFVGWYTQKDGAGTKYESGNSFDIKANVTLYADWIIDSKTVGYTFYSGFTDNQMSSEFPFDIPTMFFNSADNTVFHKDICSFASILAIDISYDAKAILDRVETSSKSQNDNTGLYKFLGFEDIKCINFASKDDTDTEDVGRLIIAKKELDEGYFVTVSIDSTDGTVKHWKSNFDIGADTKEYYTIKGENHPLWTDKNRHKGFAVTAARAEETINKYINEKCTDKTKKTVVLITGYSRGASVANIVGTDYESGCAGLSRTIVPFTYAFGCSNTTSDFSCDGKYSSKTVFNIDSSDDLVAVTPKYPALRYGTTITVKESDFKETYNSKTQKEFVSSNLSTWRYLVENLQCSREDIYKPDSSIESQKVGFYLNKWLKDNGMEKYYTKTTSITGITISDITPGLIYAVAAYLIYDYSAINEVVLLEMLNFAEKLGGNYTALVNAFKNGTITYDGVAYGHEPLTYVVIADYLNKKENK